MAVEYTIWLSLVLIGCALGSFAGATVWRLRSRQLVEDMHDGEYVDPEEYKRLLPLSTAKVSSDRSRCLQCGHTLAWYDLVPLVSWLSLRGRCRYCKVRIGTFEPLMELGVAGLFVVSYVWWPLPIHSGYEIIMFLLWLISLVLIAILFAYDIKWFLLPDQINFSLVGVGVIMSILRITVATDHLAMAISIVGAITILSGLYYFLWLVSKGQWVGFGDVKLGLALALLLADWRLALVALFSANLIGSIVVVPGMALGKIGRKTHVPFGPLLIAGTIVAMLVGEKVVDIYTRLTF